MHSALHVSKTGLSAQDTQLATISNNLANVSTVGFKKDRVMFEDLLYQVKRQPGGEDAQDNQRPSGMQIGTGVRVVGTQKQFTEGNLQITDRPLDVAINGRGFLAFTQQDGTLAYSRNGQLGINGEGDLVNSSGLLLEPNINIPEDAQAVTITVDGRVNITLPGDPQPNEVGQIDLYDFVNPAGLEAIGGNLFYETAASGVANVGVGGEDGFGQFQQGVLEASNVDVVTEMVNMITTQRAYELNSKVVSTADQMLQYITQNL